MTSKEWVLAYAESAVLFSCRPANQIASQRRLCLQCVLYRLVPRPSHVFQYTREKKKLGRPGRFGEVMMICMPLFPQTMTEMMADT